MAKTNEVGALIELADREGLDPSLCNEDILPTPIKDRHWNKWHIASLWVGMAVCIPTYMLASQMIIGGLSWKEALAMIVLGNIIVAIPMVFNGHAGTKYGIPFPVLGRASFGWIGIQIPSVLRALVACGWFGIQTWLGGFAIVAIAGVLTGNSGLIDNFAAQFAGFIVFWFINMYFVIKGTESIRVLETLAAPILVVIGVGMLVWGIQGAGGLNKVLESSYEYKNPTVSLVAGPSGVSAELNLVRDENGETRARAYRALELSSDSASNEEAEALEAMAFIPLTDAINFPSGEAGSSYLFQFQGSADGGEPSISSQVTATAAAISEVSAKAGTSLMTYLFWLTAMVAFWATLALNIPDITRFASSQKDQVAGQFLGLPATMALYSFIGVAVTCAAVVIFDDILITNDAPWDPIRLIARLDGSPVLMIFAQLSILLATLSTNIAANVISPANSFANLWPEKISFKMGGIITGLIGIIILPWKLLGAIVGFLLTYGAILGPVVGILIADYFIVRGTKLDLTDLYRKDGRYPAINPVAVVALVIGIVPVLAGLKVPELKVLYDTGWFVGFGISFVTYVLGMKLGRQSAET